MEIPKRYFRLKKGRSASHVKWLNRETVYQGKLVSMTRRVVRLFAPDPTTGRPHVDLSYDWVTPVR
jgi:hypothetical protein